MSSTEYKSNVALKMRRLFFISLLIIFFSCSGKKIETISISDVAELARGWKAEVIAGSTESYAGWDVEIGDADNDGENEILTTGCPSSSLNMYKLDGGNWKSTLLAENLARTFPGMGLAVKIVDLDGDGTNEIILGTGQEGVGTAIYYTFRIEENRLDTLSISRPDFNKSAFTHNLAPCDIDGDGMLEVISAYCGYGEIIRYDYNTGLREVMARKIHQLSGSGEESLIADVDNDGFVEYITSNGFRKEDARVEIFEFDAAGELILPPRLVIDGYDGKRCFYASVMIGDVNNDGKNELVIGWKQDQNINRGTILGYRVGDEAEKAYTFAYEDKDLDLSYFEKMMVIADADNDGLNELLVSTRGDNLSEFIESEHLGHLFMWSVNNGNIDRELLVNFREGIAGSSWIDVGDADNDGKNEIVLATGEGDRTQKGKSYVVMLEKKD
jgi:hypothetical protein